MFSNPDPWTMVGEDQIQFIKLLVEDINFLFQVNDRINPEWFTVPELRDVVRTVRNFYDAGEVLTYEKLKDELKTHYDLNDVSKEISWLIIKEVLEDAENAENKGWNRFFITRMDEISGATEPPSNWC